MSEGLGQVGGGNKRIALLIAVLALCLALSETLGKSAQTDALARNIEASNLWAFFQAKTIRQTVVRTFSEATQLQGAKGPAESDAIAKQMDSWAKTIARWENEPETGEGRKELTQRAKQAEEKRDIAMAKYHHFELSSAAFQIAIVLASASIITGATVLVWISAGLGLAGLAFTGVGLLAPATTMISTLLAINSRARVGRRSLLPSVQRYSISMFWPTT